MEVSLGLALLAGLASFLSPCVLPLVPAYFSYLAGNTMDSGRGLIFLRGIGFVLGFSIVFIAMGATASALGKFLLNYQAVFTKVSGLIIIIFGLHLMEILKFVPLMRERRFSLNLPVISSPWGAVPLGMAFAAGWTPCVGPVLGSILLYAGSLGTVKAGVLLLTVYSIGMAVPFLLVSLAMERFKRFMQRYGRYLPWISRVSGLVMVIFGLLVFTNRIAWLSGFLPETFSL